MNDGGFFVGSRKTTRYLSEVSREAVKVITNSYKSIWLAYCFNPFVEIKTVFH